MGKTIKNSFLLFFSILLFFGIFLVDVTFYHVPSFISIYRIERELSVFVAFLLLIPVIQLYYKEKNYTFKDNLKFIGFGIILLISFLVIPFIVAKKYLVLWDNNPFLAEFPFIWNLVSSFCAISSGTIIILLLFNIQKLVYYQQTRYTKIFFKLLLFFIFSIVIGFNFFQNRYAFQPLSIPVPQLNIYSITILSIISIVIVLNTYKNTWLDSLNQKEKIIAFFFSLILLPIIIYIYFSRFITPVYAYSICLKGFSLISLGYIIVYMLFGFIGLLLRLPTAGYYDRVNKEISNFSVISQLINEQQDIDKVTNSIARFAIEATNSDICWLETIDNSDKEMEMKIVSSVNLPDKMITNFNNKEINTISNIVTSQKIPLLIDDSLKDDRTVLFKILGLSFRSILAVPLIENNRVVSIFWIGKKTAYAFKNRDINTLKTYLLQVKVAYKNLELKNFELAKLKEEPGITSIQNQGKLDKISGKLPVIKGYSLKMLQFSHNSSVWWNSLHKSDNEIGIFSLEFENDYPEDKENISRYNEILVNLLKEQNPPANIVEKGEELFSGIGNNDIKDIFFGILNLGKNQFQVATSEMNTLMHYDYFEKSWNSFQGILEANIKLNKSDSIIFINKKITSQNKSDIYSIYNNLKDNNLDFISDKLKEVFAKEQNKEKLIIFLLKKER